MYPEPQFLPDGVDGIEDEVASFGLMNNSDVRVPGAADVAKQRSDQKITSLETVSAKAANPFLTQVSMESVFFSGNRAYRGYCTGLISGNIPGRIAGEKKRRPSLLSTTKHNRPARFEETCS